MKDKRNFEILIVLINTIHIKFVNYRNKIIIKKICSPAPAADIISILLPKATLDILLTCPACERDTIRMGVLLSFV